MINEAEKSTGEISMWKNRVFMRLFASYTVSMLGHWFDMVAIMILFGYVWQAEPMLIALIPVALALPQALLGQFAGVFADRCDKVKLMMSADFATAGLTVVLLVAQSPWVALVILMLRSVVNVIHFPAQQGLIKQVVPEKLILKAVTMNGTVNQIAKIFGPVAGGAVAGFVSPQLSIFINVIAFTISGFILLSLVLQNKITVAKDDAINRKSSEGFWHAWREGWMVCFNSRIIYMTFALAFIGMMAIQMVDIQFPVLFRLIAPDQPELIGWLMGASGFGAIVMIMLLNRLKKIQGYGWILGGSAFLIGLGFGGVGYLQEGVHEILPVLLGAVTGMGAGLFMVGSQFIMQKHTTGETVGRVSGIYNTVLSVTVIIAPLLGGLLVQLTGVQKAYQLLGFSLLAIGLVAIIFQRWLWNEPAREKTGGQVLVSKAAR